MIASRAMLTTPERSLNMPPRAVKSSGVVCRSAPATRATRKAVERMSI